MNEAAAGDLDTLSLTELLGRLDDIVEPAPVSWMPETIGWGVLAAVIAIVALAAGWRWFLRWRRDGYRREALTVLMDIEATARARQDGSNAAAVAGLVRRTALAAYGRETVAPLIGEAWLDFLDRTHGGSVFREGPGRGIASAPYRPAAATGADDTAALIMAARAWIKTHHAGI
jgi:hypothetical protein